MPGAGYFVPELPRDGLSDVWYRGFYAAIAGGKLSPAAVIGPGRVSLALAIFLDRIRVEVARQRPLQRGRERAAAAGLAIADSPGRQGALRCVLLTVPDDEAALAGSPLAAGGAFSAERVVVHRRGRRPQPARPGAAAVSTGPRPATTVQIFNDDLGPDPRPACRARSGVTGDPAGGEVVAALGGRPMDVPEVGPGHCRAALVLAANGAALSQPPPPTSCGQAA